MLFLWKSKRRISTAIKYLTQSSWSHAAIYVGGCGGVDAEGRVRCFVEADMEKGVRAFPIEELEGLHLRICRPVGLSSQDAHQVATHVLGRLSDRYDLKNVFDLARYLLPACACSDALASADVSSRQQRPDACDLLDFNRGGVRNRWLSHSSDCRGKSGSSARLARSRTRSPTYPPLPLIRSSRLRCFPVLHDHQAEPMPRLSFFGMG